MQLRSQIQRGPDSRLGDNCQPRHGLLLGVIQCNFRNLGAGLTLTLINGRRGGLSTQLDPSENVAQIKQSLEIVILGIEDQTAGS